jgi:hypothetical protein
MGGHSVTLRHLDSGHRHHEVQGTPEPIKPGLQGLRAPPEAPDLFPALPLENHWVPLFRPLPASLSDPHFYSACWTQDQTQAQRITGLPSLGLPGVWGEETAPVPLKRQHLGP